MSTSHTPDTFYLLFHVTWDIFEKESDLPRVQQLISRELNLETDPETLFYRYSLYSFIDENGLWRKGCSPRGIWEWVSCIFPASRELRNLLSKPDYCMRLKIPVVVFIRKTTCLENTNKETSPVNVFQLFLGLIRHRLGSHVWISTQISTQTTWSYLCYSVNPTRQKRGMCIGDSLKVILCLNDIQKKVCALNDRGTHRTESFLSKFI